MITTLYGCEKAAAMHRLLYYYVLYCNAPITVLLLYFVLAVASTGLAAQNFRGGHTQYTRLAIEGMKNVEVKEPRIDKCVKMCRRPKTIRLIHRIGRWLMY